MRFRYYEAKTSTFGVQDTYLGNIFSPLTLNRYLYCLSNPVNYVDPTGHISLVSKFLKKAATVINPKKKHGGTAFTDQTSFANSTGQKTIYSPYWTSYNPDPAARRANADMNEEQWLFERANAAGNFSLAAWHKQKAEEMRKRYEAFYCGDAKNIGVFDAINAAYESLIEREQQHLKLDAAGLIPGLGVVFDGTNAILYLTEGDFANAGLSGIAFVPFIGEVSGVIKVGGKTISLADKAANLGELIYYSEKSGRVTRELGSTGVNIAGKNITNVDEAAELIMNAERTSTAGSKTDAYHYAGMWLSKEQLSNGKIYSLTSSDKNKSESILFQVEGGLNGKQGVFEYILEQDGTVSHQLFKPGGIINGHVSTD